MGIDSTTPFVLDYTKEQGIYTIITDFNSPEKAPLKLAADEYWMIDVGDLDQLEERCRQEGIEYIFAGCHEFCLDMTKELCRRLHAPFYASEEGWEVSRDKTLFKAHCISCDIDVAHGYQLSNDFAPQVLQTIVYPVVVKPSDASAERGLSVCYDEGELSKAYLYAQTFSQNGNIIVEEYVDGDEVDIFYYVDNEEAHLLAVHDNLQCFVNGRMNMSFVLNQSRYYDEYVAQVDQKVKKLIQRMRCHTGVVFFQAIRKNGKYYFLETGHRLDGVGCWVAMKWFCQCSYLEWMVDLAIGKHPVIAWNALDLSPQQKHSAIYLYWARPGRVCAIQGKYELAQMNGVTIGLERFRPGDVVQKTDNFLQIAWYLQIIAENTEQLVNKLVFINQTLRLVDQQGNSMMIPYEDYSFVYQHY